MAEYTVEKVSQQPPREWDGPNGKVYYLKVMLSGHDRPVSIGKKAPDALHVGDTVYGTITPDPKHDEDKFKSESKPFGGGGGAPRGTTPEDKESIARSVALKAAVDFYGSSSDGTQDLVLKTADTFLAWLKGGETQTGNKEEPHYEGGGF